jgi:hypothetical protein
MLADPYQVCRVKRTTYIVKDTNPWKYGEVVKIEQQKVRSMSPDIGTVLTPS